MRRDSWERDFTDNSNVFRDLATEQERQLKTARVNQTTGLTNDRAANWALEIAFSPFRVLSCRQLTFPFFS